MKTSRLGPLGPVAAGSPLEAFVEKVHERRPELLNLHRTVGHAPSVAKAFVELAYALRFEVELDRVIQELAIAFIARASGSEYEWQQHVPIALSVGIPNEQLEAIRIGQIDSTIFSKRERCVLAYASAVFCDGTVDYMQFAAVKAFFTEREMVELTLTITFYAATASLVKALDVKPEPTS